MGYVIECWSCRTEGTPHKYIGESSRSPYQRGKEHGSEIKAGKATHPLTIHFEEAHNGNKQEVLIRVVKHARSPLSRQTWESVEIDRQDPTTCLNLKTEWGKSRDPALINNPRPAKKPKPEPPTEKKTGDKESGRTKRVIVSEVSDQSRRPAREPDSKRMKIDPQELDPELYHQMFSPEVQNLAARKAGRLETKRTQARLSYYSKLETYKDLVSKSVMDKAVATAWRLARIKRTVGLGIPAEEIQDTIVEEDGEENVEENNPATTSTATAATAGQQEVATAATTPVAVKIRRWEHRAAGATAITSKAPRHNVATKGWKSAATTTTTSTTTLVTSTAATTPPTAAAAAAATTTTAAAAASTLGGPDAADQATATTATTNTTTTPKVAKFQPTLEMLLARRQAPNKAGKSPQCGPQGSQGSAGEHSGQATPQPSPGRGQGILVDSQARPGPAQGNGSGPGGLEHLEPRFSRGKPPGRVARGRLRRGRGRRGAI